VGGDRARLGEHLPALDLLALGAAEERTGVVAACAEPRVLLNISTPVTTVFATWMDADDLDFSPILISPCRPGRSRRCRGP
jgi:hypothetical protein